MAKPREAINQRKAPADTDWQFNPPLIRQDFITGEIEGSIEAVLTAGRERRMRAKEFERAWKMTPRCAVCGRRMRDGEFYRWVERGKPGSVVHVECERLP